MTALPCIYPRSLTHPRSGAHQRSAPYCNVWHNTSSLSTQPYVTTYLLCVVEIVSHTTSASLGPGRRENRYYVADLMLEECGTFGVEVVCFRSCDHWQYLD